jgi:hypothetical protein
MMMTHPGFDQPATYRITVLGHLNAEWIDYLHGMRIDNRHHRDAKIATVTGSLPDQAALLGVLNTFYDCRVTVLSVESLGVGENASELFGFLAALQ